MHLYVWNSAETAEIYHTPLAFLPGISQKYGRGSNGIFKRKVLASGSG